MSYQSEKQLEDMLILNLKDNHKYEFIQIKDQEGLELNFRNKLNSLNSEDLKGTNLSDKEFERVLIYVKGKSVFQSAKQLRSKFQLQRDDGSIIYMKLIDFESPSKNSYQISNQITMRGKYQNRYDVTILINGLPVVQIELKRRGLPLKDAFNQISRYDRHSYDGLFKYIQIFIISNGVETKYFSNSDKGFQYSLTFYWTDEKNNRINQLNDFSDVFLTQNHLMQMINTYTILNDTEKTVMVMRPYQVYAVKAVVKTATETANGGFIWHTTGSGKTMTSFKVSEILSKEPSIKKVIFLIDRNDLDSQTVEEFNKFEKNSVDITNNTSVLVKQMKDISVNLIVTTVQKMNNAIKKEKYKSIMEQYQDEKVIFVIDECHRSTFGSMHTEIRRFFKKAQFFGFTGTPRFKENKSQDGRTTEDVFGRCLHSYILKEAIFDNNVLGFSVEYIKTFDGQYDEEDGERVVSIDTEEVYNAPERISMVANHIIQCHDQKTMRRKYTAMFAVSEIPMLIEYYKEFKNIKHDLKIAAIYSFQANEEIETKDEHSREALDSIIKDYNNIFGTSFNTETFGAYQNDVSKRVKKGEIDLLIVVRMFLTGFDSKSLNTLYVDKSLKWHDLLQSFSRTNRVFDPTKKWGNIVCYRNLKPETDAAIKLFSNSDNTDCVLQEGFDAYLQKFKSYLNDMYQVVTEPEDIDKLYSEEDQKKFVVAFKNMAQTLLALGTFVEFEFTEEMLGINEQTYEDFKSRYLTIRENVSHSQKQGKTSILDDIDFAIEIVQTDRINVSYIMNLLRNIEREDKKQQQRDIKHILGEIGRSDNPQLKKKADLIRNFLEKEFANLDFNTPIDEAFGDYEEKIRNEEIKEFAEKENIEIDFLKDLISQFEFTGIIDKGYITSQIKKPFLEKRTIAGKIIDFIKENVFKYQ